MPKLFNLTHIEPSVMWTRVCKHSDGKERAAFLRQRWSKLYGAEDQMDTLSLEGMKPLLPIENKGMYASVLCKFANVGRHRDTHDDEYYILYVVSGSARLHVGSRNTESIDLAPGMCVLFNCDAFHWAEGDGNNPVRVVIGGVTRARGRAILWSKDPAARFQSLMAESLEKNHDGQRPGTHPT